MNKTIWQMMICNSNFNSPCVVEKGNLTMPTVLCVGEKEPEKEGGPRRWWFGKDEKQKGWENLPDCIECVWNQSELERQTQGERRGIQGWGGRRGGSIEHLGEWENSEEPSSNSRRKLLKTGWVTDSQQLNVGSNVEIRVDDVKQCIVKEKPRRRM